MTRTICGSRPAATAGVSASGLVSISARRVTRSGARRKISIATMPPMLRPARAKRCGSSSNSPLAISSIRSPRVTGATVTVYSDDNSAICGPKRRASHIIPGRNTIGSGTCLPCFVSLRAECRYGAPFSTPSAGIGCRETAENRHSVRPVCGAVRRACGLHAKACLWAQYSWILCAEALRANPG